VISTSIDFMPYLLDTNVVSELRRGERATPSVLAWRRNVAHEETFISILVLGEMRRGIELKRRRDPASARVFEKWLKEIEATFGEQILPVNREICDAWGYIAARANVSTIDGLIAATAAHHGLTVATRNTVDFQRTGVDYFNPFTGGKP
jgi:predicted nucleic acid-binding protein